MSEKPLVEVMAIAFQNEAARLRPDEVCTWEQLFPERQAELLACMVEAARVVGYFEKRGRVMLVDIPPKEQPRPKRKPPDLDPTSTFPEQISFPGYTGIPCGECQSPNTVRTGSCLKCHSCFAETECG